MRTQAERNYSLRLNAAILAIGLFVPVALGQTTPAPSAAAPSKAAPDAAPAASSAHRSLSRTSDLSQHAIDHYQLLYGVDSFQVRTVESGLMVRFSYRVVDSQKATIVNDKKANPFLVDEAAHVKLVVPTMEKVGQLRQSGSPEVGKSYWMVFSNKGNIVKPGDRVTVVVGKFRVDGLIVQ